MATTHLLETQTPTTGSRRFSIEEYERIHESGILGPDERVELIRGEIIEMGAIGFRHAETVSLTTDAAGPMIGPDRSWAGNPIHLPGQTGQSLPQPDYAVVKPGRYTDRRPTAEDILFVVEVSDSSKQYDLSVKLPLYAAAGIPEAWLFDLIEDRIQRHTDPGPDGYRQVASVGRGEFISSLVLPTVRFVADEVLAAPNSA
jgi:Uma2 family endonuclease